VRPNFANLSTRRPEQLPTPTTCLASEAGGMAMTQDFAADSRSNE